MTTINIRDSDVFVDEEDVERINKHNWWLHDHKNTDRYTYFRGIVNGKFMYLHRFIMGVYDINLVVDHINHNTLDNTKSNLRICSRRENGINRNSVTSTTALYVGVKRTVTKKYGIVWGAVICIHGNNYALGVFSTAEDAARAYDIANLYHNKLFVYTNFPIATYAEINISEEYTTLMRSRRYITNTSGYRGVSWNSKKAKWTVHIVHNYKQHVVGYFSDKVKAAEAYDAKARELGKPEFYLNFPT